VDENKKSWWEGLFDKGFRICILAAVVIYTPKVIDLLQSIADSLKMISKGMGSSVGGD
jgi:hypothetical protein